MLRKLLSILSLLSMMLASVPTSWLHWDEPEPIVSEAKACETACNHNEGHLQSEGHSCLLLQLYVEFSEVIPHYEMRAPQPSALPYPNTLIHYQAVPFLLRDLSRGPPTHLFA